MTAGIEDKRSPLARALGGKVPFRRVRVERGRLAGLDIAVRTLPLADIQAASRAALRYLTEECGWREEHLYTELGEGVHDAETQVQLLARCLLVPPDGAEDGAVERSATAPLVSGVDELRALLDGDEVALLFQEFTRWQQERSPISRAKSAEEIEAHVEALGKGGTPLSWLRSCDSGTLLAIATELAVRLMTSTSSSSSDTSPASDTSPGCSSSSDSDDPTTNPTTPTLEVLSPR